MNACEKFYDPSEYVLQILQMHKNACKCRFESYECVANETWVSNLHIKLYGCFSLSSICQALSNSLIIARLIVCCSAGKFNRLTMGQSSGGLENFVVNSKSVRIIFDVTAPVGGLKTFFFRPIRFGKKRSKCNDNEMVNPFNTVMYYAILIGKLGNACYKKESAF